MTDITTVYGNDDWWKSAVVYQVYPRSFADSNGDGIGDLPGIIDKLDYLAELGVDVVWLSPIYASPQADNGYDISDYYAVDPVFGSLDDLDRLIAGLHERGMKLMMDLVVNHTSDEHPWFVESSSSLDNPKRDWYIWRQPRPGFAAGELGAEPNNWASLFFGPAWQLDERTQEYYLHLFAIKQADLNWENPEVREAVYEMMRWWLDRGVDGFRMDVINFISKADGLPDAPVTPGATLASGFPLFSYGPHIHEYLQEMHQAVFAGRPEHVLTVGEMPGASVEQARLYTDQERGELDMVFQFEHVELDYGPDGRYGDARPLPLVELKSSLATWQLGLSDVGWNSLYWSNHDQPRAVSRFGDDGEYRQHSAKLLGTVLHLLRGTPYIYQGEELGMANTVFDSIDDVRDIESLRYYAQQRALGVDDETLMRQLRGTSRDNARTPMQWTDAAHAGFTTGTPWIAATPDHTEVNAQAAVADPDSIYHYYRMLIALRKSDPVIVNGDFHLLLPNHESVFAYERRLEGRVLRVVANFSSVHTSVELDDEGFEPLLSNYDASPVALRPWEVRVSAKGY